MVEIFSVTQVSVVETASLLIVNVPVIGVGKVIAKSVKWLVVKET